MFEFKTEYILLFIVIVFLLYNLMDSCLCANRWDGFSVGAQLQDPPTQKCSDLIKEGKGGCNFWGGCEIGDCQFAPSFCGQNKANCKTCGGNYCSNTPEPPAPPPPPPGPPAPPPQHGTKIIPRNSFTPENIRDNLILTDLSLTNLDISNKLLVGVSTDISAVIGRAQIGQVGFNGWAGFKNENLIENNQYALFIANYARLEPNVFKNLDLFTNIRSGYALGYSYNSFIGPIELKYSWSPDTKESYWLFNLGFWF